MLQNLEDKIVTAEDEAEKVAILAAPLQMEIIAELQALQMESVRETEKAVKMATVSLNIAQRELDKRNREAQLMAPRAKARAEDAIGQLRERLESAKAKVEEHRNVRKDYELALAAEKDYGELATRLAGVEIDAERAAVLAEPLSKALDMNPDDLNAADIKEAKEAVRVAQTSLAPALRLIQGRAAGVKGSIRTKLLDLVARAEASQALLETSQKTIDEAESRAAAMPLLKQATEKVDAIEDILYKMRETETPFLLGDETMTADERGELLETMTKSVTSADADLNDTLKFVEAKMVEVSRLTAGAAESAQVELEKAKKQVQAGLERVKKFRAITLGRKREHLVEAVNAKVEVAEAGVARLKEAGAELQGTPTPGEKAVQQLEALETARAVEAEAQAAVAAARRELDVRQQELGQLEGEGGQDAATGSNSDFQRTKARMSSVETELAKFQRLMQDLDRKLEVDRSLADISASLADLDREAVRLSAASEAWPADERPPEEDERTLGEAQQRMSRTAGEVEEKLKRAQGLELKALRGIFERLTEIQDKLERLRGIARERSRAVSQRAVREATDILTKAEREATELGGQQASEKRTVAELQALNEQAKAALLLIEEARKALAGCEGPQVFAEAKNDVKQLASRFRTVERKTKAAALAITDKFEGMASTSLEQTLGALRGEARGDDGNFDPMGLFAKLSKGTQEITEQQFCDFLLKERSSSGLSEETVQLAYKRIAPHRLRRRTFAAALADMRKVTRDVTLTNVFDIKTAKKVRKLELGEVLEGIGASQEDSNLEVERMQCRAVKDGAMGWVTVKNKAGTTYLTRTEKPFLWCRESLALHEEAEETSAVVREVTPGEVLEVVEGPRDGKPGDMRVQGVACHEDTAGWLHICDAKGTLAAQISDKIHKCVERVAMTQEQEFEKCTMVRRIDIGEALEILPNPPFEPSEGTQRRKFRACSDGKEGWITVSGNKGKVFLKAAQNHYICLKETPVHTGLDADSSVARVLMPGEAFAADEEPQEVSGGKKLLLYRTCANTDGASGWVSTTMVEEKVQQWSSRYKVLKPVALTGSLVANEAVDAVEVLRTLETGELLDIVEHPTLDDSTGQLRAQFVALKDKVVGWASVRDSESGLTVCPVPRAEEEVRQGQQEKPPEPEGAPEKAEGEKQSSAKGGKGGRGSKTGKGGKGRGKRGQKRPLEPDAQDHEPSRDRERSRRRMDRGKGGRGRGREEWGSVPNRLTFPVRMRRDERYDDGPPRRWDGGHSERYDGGHSERYDGGHSERYDDGPRRRYDDAPPRHRDDHPPHRYEDLPSRRYDGGAPHRYDGAPPHRYDDGPRRRYDGPPPRQYDDRPRERYEGRSPRRYEGGPPDRYDDGPRYGGADRRWKGRGRGRW